MSLGKIRIGLLIRHLLRLNRVQVEEGCDFGCESQMRRSRVRIAGRESRVCVASDGSLDQCLIDVRGDHNRVDIGSGCRLASNVSRKPFL